MRNNTYLKLDSIYKKYKGYIGTKELMEEELSNRQIAALAEEGYLEKICRGHYWIAGRYGKPTDYKCIEVCLSNPRAVVCMDSAIYYQGEALILLYPANSWNTDTTYSAISQSCSSVPPPTPIAPAILPLTNNG